MNFDCCNPSSDIKDLHPVLYSMLEDMEKDLGFELCIHSAYRSLEYDKSKGRSGDSCHCEKLAVDIHCMVNNVRFKLVRAAIKVGFNRIGIGRTFIHLDIGAEYSSKNKSSDVLWLYK